MQTFRDGRSGMSYGYLLGYKKKMIFSSIIRLFNERHARQIRIANTAEFGVYSRETCVTENFVQEIKAFHNKDMRYTGKISHVSTDDLITWAVMATYLCIAHRAQAPTRMRNIETEQQSHCTAPWISSKCNCPVRG